MTVRGLFNTVRHEIRYWFLRKLPTCRAMMPLMSESLERRLTVRERMVLRLHLAVCIWCEWYLEKLHELRSLSRARGEVRDAEPARSTTLSTEARERIKRRLDKTV
jgi:hypothetical protein